MTAPSASLSAGGGAIAAGHRLTAEAGAAVLRDGGNAVDAALAAMAMSCLCEPVLSSPGGGGFALLRDASGNVELIDFFPHTPLRRHAELGVDGLWEIVADFGTTVQAFHIGPATSATPGFAAGVDALHSRGATIPLGDLFAGAIAASRDGVVVTPFQHYLATVVEPILTATPAARSLFAPDGALIAAGDRYRNPGLGDALASLAADGFVGGPVGAACTAEQADRGHLTAADLANYRVEFRSPLSIEVGDTRVHLNPFPAAGGTLVAHALAQLADASPTALARALRATDEARRRLAGLPIRQKGTTHISVIDRAGDACSVTISNGEGNGELVGEFGFMLNNVLGEDDVNPAGADGWVPDVRLSSMMCPTIIEHADGTLTALGSGGSSRIRSAIASVVARLVLGGIPLEDAIVAPRLHVEREHLDVEDLFADRTVDELCIEFPDHRRWPDRNLYFGGVHAVQLDPTGNFTAVGDPRRDGTASHGA